MKYTIRGDLRAQLAEEFEEPIGNVGVRIYDADHEELGEKGIRKATAARTKRTFAVLSEDEVRAKRDALLGEGRTQEDGSFTVDIDESAEFRPDESGRPDVLQVDLRLDTVPSTRAEPENSVQATLTLHEPSWQPAEPSGSAGESGGGQRVAEQTEQLVTSYRETLSRKHYCDLLEAAGVWLVAGRVTVDNTTAPVSGATVTAKDADIIQHDELGSDQTNAGGYFSIYYTQAEFEETPPPWGPIELKWGPDLYFSIEQSGQTYLDEDPDAGRKPGRENADHCEYVELSVTPVREEPEETPIVPTYWARVGRAFDVPLLFSPGDFDSDGYAGNQKFALYGTLTMEGTAPLFDSMNPDQYVEYRFLVSEQTGSSTNYKPIGVGTQQYQDAFDDGLVVGEILAYDDDNSQLRTVPVRVNTGHLSSDGWLSVREAANDALNATIGTDLDTLRQDDYYFGWNDRDPLMGIDTRQFTSEPNVDDAATSDPVPDPGESVPPSRQIDEERIAIRFESRVVDDAGNVSSGSNTWVISGVELNPVVVNNNTEFAVFQNENLEQDACDIVTGDVDLKYTVHHPHLDGVKLRVKANDEAATDISQGDIPFAFDPSTHSTAGDDEDFADTVTVNGGGSILDEPCGYRTTLRVRRRLHNGYHRDDWDTRGESIFYWDGT